MYRVPGRLAAASLILLVSLSLPARLDAQNGTIQGTVSDSNGAPVAGASIVLDGTGLSTMTRSAGTYEIRGVAPGSYTLRARLIGYNPARAEVTVRGGETVRRDVTLTQAPTQLAPIDVVVGSRARHTAAEELAVPVDIYTAEEIRQQGTTETSQILQQLSPSINFPRQSVTDADDVVRPFTLRGLSPDHTLVLLNGWRRHQTALVHIFPYGTGGGSSGVDLNALPASAIDRIEVLRDGASAQYGSDAIAGVVNIVTRDGSFAPFASANVGRFVTRDYPDDGTAVDVNGGWGVGVGRGSLGLFAEYRHRDPTNRAWPDPTDEIVAGDGDIVDDDGHIITKRNPVQQPNHHWGDGLAKDVMTFANFRMPVNASGKNEVYAFGGYSFRQGTGNGFRRYGNESRNWSEIFPLGFLPTFDPDVQDFSAAGGFRGVVAGWQYDFGASFGHDDIEYNLTNTLNVSLGPCLGDPCAPGVDGVLGNADDPGISNQTSFFAGRLLRDELVTGVNAARELSLGLPAPLNLAVGVTFRRERYKITPGETASWIQGGHLDRDSAIAPAGSQVFAGFQPSAATNSHRNNFGVYADAETKLTPRLLANAAARFETYSDFGERATGKLALRYQPTRRLTFRGALSTGFRAPGLSQSHFINVSTTFVFNPATGRPEPVDFGIFPADHPAARALGAKPLQEETSVNFSGGFAFSPRDNVTLTADYFRIDIDNRIILSGLLNTDSVAAILAGAGLAVNSAQYFTNALDTRTQGVDVTANVRLPAGTSGTFDLTGGLNYGKNEILRESPLPPELEGTGVAGLLDVVSRVAIERERPDWRGTLTAGYSLGRFRSLARGSYYGGFSSAQPGFCDTCEESYGGKTLFDAELGYQFNQVGLSLGVRNIFDTYPDQASEMNSFGIFPWAAASPFGYNGRYLYTRVEMTFSP